MRTWLGNVEKGHQPGTLFIYHFGISRPWRVKQQSSQIQLWQGMRSWCQDLYKR